MRIIAVSDTHGLHSTLAVPPGDVFVHAGDITGRGTIEEVRDFNKFLGSLPHPHKIVIAGNHDFCLEHNRMAGEAELTHCIYLRDQEATIMGVRFYGSPWQPWFYDFAFNLQRGDEIRSKWDMIPVGIDVLITHGPPYGHGDLTWQGDMVGCKDLLEVVEKIKPQVHFFGHIHEGAGISSNDQTVFINASTCDHGYEPVNPPVIYEYELKSRK